MKAMVYHTYGPPDVLHLEEIDKPPVGDDEVLVRVHAAALNAADWHLVRGEPFAMRFFTGGILKPKHTVLGADMAGVVEAVGGNVTQFQPGDAVFGDLSSAGWGACAEYVAVAEKWLAHKAEKASFAEAAAACMAAVTALQGLRDKGKIQAGQRVMIHGASGGVGTFAVQLAKAFDTEVTAVCSTRHVELVRGLGADHVIDYTQEDFTQNGQRYDLILAANGTRSMADYRRSLTPNGACIVTGGGGSQLVGSMLLGPWISLASSQTVGNVLAQPNAQDLTVIKELMDAGKVKSVIDRCFPLAEAADALRYLETGHARGKVVIQVTPDN